MLTLRKKGFQRKPAVRTTLWSRNKVRAWVLPCMCSANHTAVVTIMSSNFHHIITSRTTFVFFLNKKHTGALYFHEP